MESYTPAVKKALEYLDLILGNGNLKPGEHLPSIQKLASKAQVSSVPMWKAVNLLAQKGVLEVIQGRGTRIPVQHDETLAPTVETWWRIREQIHREILGGKYSIGLMPSLKEMRIQYGVSYNTLKKALESLVSDGIIEPCHRTYRAISYVNQVSVSSVVLLGWSIPELDLQARTPWGEEFLRSCENQCSQMRLNFKVVRYNSVGGITKYIDQDGKAATELKENDSVLGFILWADSPDELYRDVLKQLNKFKKPIAVLQEGSLLRISDFQEQNRKIQVFSLATSSKAAKQVASFMLELGHKSIAYFSPFHLREWSKARLSGLEEIFSRHSGMNIQAYTIDKLGSHSFIEMVRPDKVFESFISKAQESPDMPELLINALKNVRMNITKSLLKEAIRESMKPLFEKAFADGNKSAWVCANDNVAIMALEWLKEHGGRIAIAGFDDTFEAFRTGLTSYNFNVQALVNCMLSFLVSPSSHSTIQRAGIFEVEGMLVERRTTFKVS